MQTQNIETIIRNLFRENFNSYPESYPLNDAGGATSEAYESAREVAKGYWNNRLEDEIERDEKAGVKLIDYTEWCVSEFVDLIPEKAIEARSETFDIVFDSETNSNTKGFRESLDFCKNYIHQHQNTNDSYFADYKGGSVRIVNNATGETIHEEVIK